MSAIVDVSMDLSISLQSFAPLSKFLPYACPRLALEMPSGIEVNANDNLKLLM